MAPAERLLPQIALSVTLAAGCCAAGASLFALALGNTEGVDTAVFLFAFGVLLPATVVTVARGGPLARAEPGAISALAALAAIGLVVVLVATRIVDSRTNGDSSSSVIMLVLLGVWAGGIAISAARARRGKPPLIGDRAVRVLPWLPIVLVSGLVAAYAFAPLPQIGDLLLSLLLGALLLTVHLVLRPAELIGRRGVIALDIAAAAAILLLVSDVTAYTSQAQLLEPDSELGGGTLASWLQFHHHPFLGPTNDVLEGRTVLVDTYSAYGIANIYLFAAVFQLVPIGYGTFGMIVAAGLALVFAAAYAILRLAGCSQVLAMTAMAAAIFSSVFNTIGSPAATPSLGVIRWGFGYLLVLLALLALRSERWAPRLRIASAAIVGVSAIWSFEVFIYTSATYATLVAFWAALEGSERGWLRSVASMLVPAAAAVVVAHLTLALGTLIVAGQLPDWTSYLAFLREFSVGPLNRIPAQPWWSGVVVGALYFASAAAVAAVVSRARDFASENGPALMAIAGMTAFGVATLTYAVRFSHDDAVMRLSLPALMLAALWIHLAARSGLARPTRTALAATGFWLAALLLVQGWNDFERKAGRAPLVAALPGVAGSIEDDISRTWSNPPIDGRLVAAEGLIDRYWPNESRALVLLFPDLNNEVLMRSGRANLLPIAYPTADNFISEETWDRVRPAVDQIESGTLMLTERFYLTPGARRDYIAPGSPALSLEQMVIDRIRSRFELQPVAGEGDGDTELLVVRLVARS